MPSQPPDLRKAAAAGGISAGVFIFLVLALPPTLLAFRDAEIASWLPVVLLGAGMNGLFASALGTLAGASASRTEKPLLGALIGTLIFFLGSLVYTRLMISTVEPYSHTTYVIVWAVVTGYLAGAIGSLACCRITFLYRSLLLIPPILLAGIFTAVEEKERQLRNAMYAHGCIITWNAVTHPEGRWEVRFQDSKINDEALLQLIGPLARYKRLDLDLSHSQVTDQSIAHLLMLTNLVCLHLENTAVTDQAIAQLRNKLPDVTISK